MTPHLSRRSLLKVMAASGAAAVTTANAPPAEAGPPGWVTGLKTGARVLVETLQAEGVCCVFGIPGAQENELWDQMKARGLPYLLVTHELSAACMADGYARARAGRACCAWCPARAITNALTGMGEALLDSVPLVCIAGDVARGDEIPPFPGPRIAQRRLAQAGDQGRHRGGARRTRFPTPFARPFIWRSSGEPGPVAVVVPYNLLIESHKFDSAPLPRSRLCLRRGRVPARRRPAEQSQAPRRDLCRARLHGLLRRPDEDGGAAAGPGGDQRLGQGRHQRVPSAGRRLGLWPARNARGASTPSSMSISCWPLASASARCPRRSIRCRSTNTSSTLMPAPTIWGAVYEDRAFASMPTPACS